MTSPSRKPYRRQKDPYDYSKLTRRQNEIIQGLISGQPDAYITLKPTAEMKEAFIAAWGPSSWDIYVNEGTVPENMDPVWVLGTKFIIGSKELEEAEAAGKIFGGEVVIPAEPDHSNDILIQFPVPHWVSKSNIKIGMLSVSELESFLLPPIEQLIRKVISEYLKPII